MAIQIKKAERKRRPFRVSLEGLSGGGKTYTALRFAFQLKREGVAKKIAVMDSEGDSASVYAGEIVDGERWDFDTVEMNGDQSPTNYANTVRELVKAGYDLIIIDSLSHAWMGTNGALEQVDRIGANMDGNNFRAWSSVTPVYREMIQTITGCAAHIIVTMRVKMEHVQSKNSKGKTVIEKKGLKTEARDGSEYEFDVVVRLARGAHAKVEKTRCSAIDGRSAVKPGESFWQPLIDWWKTGSDAAPTPTPPAPKLDPALFGQMMKFMENAKDADELKPHFQVFHLSKEKFTPEQYAQGEALKNRLKEKFAAEAAAKAATTVPPGVTAGEPSNAERLAKCRTWLAANIASFDADAFPEKVVKFLDDKFTEFATYTPGALERAILAALPDSAHVGELLPAELATARTAVTDFAATLVAKGGAA